MPWRFPGPLYAIVDAPDPDGKDLAEVTRAVLVGASVVQLRAKEASTAQRVGMLAALAPLCAAAGAVLIANDDLDAAVAVDGVAGVHLGQGDPGVDGLVDVRARARAAGRDAFVVGLSTHNDSQLRAALSQGPDYVAFGPIATTTSKADHDPPVGLDGLRAACRISGRPLVAIGGLDVSRGCAAIEVGADAVAVINALHAPTVDGVAHAARRFAEALHDAGRPIGLDEVVRLVPALDRDVLVALAQHSDDLGLQITLGLPARFRPRCIAGEVQYRRCEVADLLEALGAEQQFADRLIQLRRR